MGGVCDVLTHDVFMCVCVFIVIELGFEACLWLGLTLLCCRTEQLLSAQVVIGSLWRLPIKPTAQLSFATVVIVGRRRRTQRLSGPCV